MTYELRPEDGSYKVMAEVQVLHVLKCGRLALQKKKKKKRNELLICIKLQKVPHQSID